MSTPPFGPSISKRHDSSDDSRIPDTDLSTNCRSSSLDHAISYVHSPVYKAHAFPMQSPLQFYCLLQPCLRLILLHVFNSPPPKKRSNLRDSRYQLSAQCHGQSRSVFPFAMVYSSPLLLTYCITLQRVLRSLQSLRTRSP